VNKKKQQSPHVLVVDDDSMNRRFYLETLKRENYQVDEAPSGEVAVKQIQQTNYDLVVSDMQMKALSGLDVLKAAKEKSKQTQVIIVTGYGNIPSAVEAMRQGAFDYLPKPVNKDTFVFHVKKALNQQKLEKLIQQQNRKINEYHDMIERDLNFAKKVHNSLIPGSFEHKHFSFGISYSPMIGIGGDFGNVYVDEKNNHLYMNVLDVTGHGIASALVVNRISSKVGALVREHASPREILHHINEFFCGTFAKTGIFLTMMSVRLDWKRKVYQFAGSAHPSGLHYSSDTGNWNHMESENVIIGFDSMPLKEFQQETRKIAPGDRLAIFTDGIIEPEDKQGIPFGLERVRQSLDYYRNVTVKNSAQNVMQDVRSYNRGDSRDDILLMMLELKS